MVRTATAHSAITWCQSTMNLGEFGWEGGVPRGNEEFTVSAREEFTVSARNATSRSGDWELTAAAFQPTLGTIVRKTSFSNLIGYLGASMGRILRDRMLDLGILASAFQFWLCSTVVHLTFSKLAFSANGVKDHSFLKIQVEAGLILSQNWNSPVKIPKSNILCLRIIPMQTPKCPIKFQKDVFRTAAPSVGMQLQSVLSYLTLNSHL